MEAWMVVSDIWRSGCHTLDRFLLHHFVLPRVPLSPVVYPVLPLKGWQLLDILSTPSSLTNALPFVLSCGWLGISIFQFWALLSSIVNRSFPHPFKCVRTIAPGRGWGGHFHIFALRVCSPWPGLSAIVCWNAGKVYFYCFRFSGHIKHLTYSANVEWTVANNMLSSAIQTAEVILTKKIFILVI